MQLRTDACRGAPDTALRHFVTYQILSPKLPTAPGSPLFRKGLSGIAEAQDLGQHTHRYTKSLLQKILFRIEEMVLSKSRFNGLKQILLRAWFGEEAKDVVLIHCSHCSVDIRVSSQSQADDCRGEVADFRQELRPIHLRHAHAGDDFDHEANTTEACSMHRCVQHSSRLSRPIRLRNALSIFASIYPRSGCCCASIAFAT